MLICSGPNVQDASALINLHLKVITQWTVNNRMQSNLSKSSMMWLRAPSQCVVPFLPEIFVNDICLAVPCKQRYFSLILDDIFHGHTMSLRYANQCLIIYIC